MIASSDELAEKLIKHQVVSALLNVVANAGHPESQKYATSNLVYLVDRFDYVAKTLKEHMGQNFFELLEVAKYLPRTNQILSIENLQKNRSDTCVEIMSRSEHSIHRKKLWIRRKSLIQTMSTEFLN